MWCTRRIVVGLTGIAATLLLHSLIFAVAIWDGNRLLLHPRLPDAVGAGANTGKQNGEPGERRMLVMLNPDFDDSPPLEPAPLLAEPFIQQPSVLAITGPDALPLPAFEIETPGEDLPDQDAELMARAKFAGIYESQVRARIERAWQLSKDLPPEPNFSCLVRIHQQRDGRVREVALVLSKCNGSSAWQQSLVDAIQTASPLPAPPHPSVFVDEFSLVFSSDRLVVTGGGAMAMTNRLSSHEIKLGSGSRKRLLPPISR